MVNDMVCTSMKVEENLLTKVKTIRFNEPMINKIIIKKLLKEVKTCQRKKHMKNTKSKY